MEVDNDMQHMRSSEPVFEENPPRKPCSSPPCKYCGKVFGSLKALHGHMRSHSNKLPSSLPLKRKRASRKPRQHFLDSSSASSDSEEEEMRKMREAAECLLMLSRGRWVEDHHHPSSADSEATPVSTDSEAEEEKKKKKKKRRVYTCVTCGRTFGSFQALGGHRVYHNRCSGEEDRPMKVEGGEVTSKVHACEVCEKVFPTGQALGGHMRKHYNAQPLKQEKTEEESRPATAIPTIALFDLNLPAVPEY